MRTFTFGIEEDFVWIEDESTWDKLTDYQGTKIGLRTDFGKVKGKSGVNKFGIEITYRTGQVDSNFGENITFDFSLYYNLKVNTFIIPLMATYHIGYLSELYQFEQKSS